MAAENEGGDVLDGDLEFFGEEEAEAGRVEHAGHADDHVLRQAGELLQRPDHRVERVGDADDEGVRRILLDAGADLFHDLEVDAEQVVAAHAGLAGNTGSDDADVGTFDRSVVAGTRQRGIEAFDRRGLGDIEALALRDTVGNVEEDDVAQLLQAGEMRQRATDHARTNKCDLLAGHESFLCSDQQVRNVAIAGPFGARAYASKVKISTHTFGLKFFNRLDAKILT